MAACANQKGAAALTCMIRQNSSSGTSVAWLNHISPAALTKYRATESRNRCFDRCDTIGSGGNVRGEAAQRALWACSSHPGHFQSVGQHIHQHQCDALLAPVLRRLTDAASGRAVTSATRTDAFRS